MLFRESSCYEIHFILSADSMLEGQPGQGQGLPQASHPGQKPIRETTGPRGSSVTCSHTQRHTWPSSNSRKNSNQTTKPLSPPWPTESRFHSESGGRVPGPSSRPASPHCSLLPLPGPAGYHSRTPHLSIQFGLPCRTPVSSSEPPIQPGPSPRDMWTLSPFCAWRLEVCAATFLQGHVGLAPIAGEKFEALLGKVIQAPSAPPRTWD